MDRPIVIAAGGTAGHFYPAEALASVLAGRGYSIVLMSDERTGRRSSGPFASVPQHLFPVSGVVGRSAIKQIKGLLTLAGASWHGRTILREIRPAAVVGFGGYSCVPALGGSLLLGRSRPRLILHEGNAVLGQANRRLARHVDSLATSYITVDEVPPGVRTVVTGLPVRADVEAMRNSELPPVNGGINLLIWGGSLGARIFADIVPAALQSLPDDVRNQLLVTQQARAEDVERVTAGYAGAGIRAHVAPFLDKIGKRLASSHLVIGRAGGSSIAEIATVGRASILVPLPIAASDEQGTNARRVVEAGGGWMIRQPDFSTAALSQLLRTILTDPDGLGAAGSRVHSLAHANAAQALATMVENEINRGSGSAAPSASDPTTRTSGEAS